MTVATNSYYQKLILAEYLHKTADTMDKLPFMLHDFGFRGASSVEVRRYLMDLLLEIICRNIICQIVNDLNFKKEVI